MVAAALSGCMQTPSKTPEEYIARCMKQVQYWDYTFKTEVTAFMGVSKEKMPEVFCKRILVAVQKGRITQKDVLEAHNKASPIWQVIKGR